MIKNKIQLSKKQKTRSRHVFRKNIQWLDSSWVKKLETSARQDFRRFVPEPEPVPVRFSWLGEVLHRVQSPHPFLGSPFYSAIDADTVPTHTKKKGNWIIRNNYTSNWQQNSFNLYQIFSPVCGGYHPSNNCLYYCDTVMIAQRIFTHNYWNDVQINIFCIKNFIKYR